MADTTNHENEPKHENGPVNPQVSHERSDINVFQITGFGIGLVISCLVVVFAMWALFAFLAHREEKKNTPLPGDLAQQRRQVPPEPRLSGVVLDSNGRVSPHPVYPRVELKELHDDEDAILNSYGWVDPNKGTVRIPIDQAVDIVAQKGLPSKPSPAGDGHDENGYRMIPSVASSGRTLEKIAR
jgi:hypothetical protein